MDYKDYYKILGVPKTATDKDIKAAFRKLARKHHPDLNKGDKKAEARFKEINEANEVLSDPEKRRRYDEVGPNWDSFRPGAGGPHQGAGGRGNVDFGGMNEQDLGGFSDFFRTIFGGAGGGGGGGFRTQGGGGFEEMFGRGARGPQPHAPEPPEHPIEITLEEAIHGTTRMLQIGEGQGARRVEVKIPPLMREGRRIRVAGDAGGAAGPGSVYLRVVLAPHPTFERKGDDLQVPVTVPLTTAVLGGEASVPTLEGPREIKVPAGSRPGRSFRLRGLGLPKQEGRGDLLAALSVDVPKTLTDRERELFEELRTLGH